MSEKVRAVSQQGQGKRTAAARVLALFDAFSRGGGSLTLSEISRYADLSLTTTHRLAKEVLEWGGLELDETGHYRLSRKILDLASTSTRALRVREKALPHLADLHRATCLTVHLSVRDGNEVVYVEALRAHPNYTGENRIGGRLGLHLTATGLVLLAYAGPETLEQYLRSPLKRFTPHTPSTPEQLRACLETVRRNRWAMASQYLTERAGSVAAPVVSEDGHVETAVGMVYTIGKADPHRLAELAQMTATRISNALLERDLPLDPRTIDYNRRKSGLA